MKILASIALALALFSSSGCASGPERAQQSWYAAKSRFDAALVIAGDYNQLARCGEPARIPCSKEEVVLKLRKARDVALAALDAWESVVFAPEFGADKVATARSAALAAIDAFDELSKPLEVKKP